ncbi:MAG: hypothetical protein GKR98_08160 [Boseongicola sp.]|nr:MAG: hypothetical protein GKR98_08160 [Boseongicola sp.]
MDLLQLVPITLLVVVSVWFWGPTLVDPARKRPNSSGHRLVEDADDLADEIFGHWAGTEPTVDPNRAA